MRLKIFGVYSFITTSTSSSAARALGEGRARPGARESRCALELLVLAQGRATRTLVERGAAAGCASASRRSGHVLPSRGTLTAALSEP